MELKQTIQQQIALILQELDLPEVEIELSHPQIASQGDLSTNVAMILFGNKDLRSKTKEWKSSRDLAGAISEKLVHLKSEVLFLDKVEVAGPGFINFYLKQDYFLQEFKKILSKDNESVTSASLSGKKIMIEFTDPNPFKEFHIGHLYSNSVGESISRLLEANGAEVKRANYQGDVGLHVAKAVWGMQEKLKMQNAKFKVGEIEEYISEVEKKPIGERAKWLGEAYARGASAYEEDAEAKAEIIAINKQVYQSPVILNESEGSLKEDSSLKAQNDIGLLYKMGRQWSLEYFETLYKRVGMKFDYYYFESAAGPIGLELVKEYLTKGIFTESNGAIIFPGEDHGLHTRVFINSLGLPTYEAKELGLATTKYADYPFDLSISITGNEINEYFKVLLKVLSLVKPEIAEKTRHLSHGMVRLPEGKMSSRTGNVLTGEWLLDEAVTRLKQAYPEMDDTTVEQVAVASIKWALLKSSIGKDISFDFDASISFEGDSGPYIQYTYARTCSVLAKSEGQMAKSKPETLSLAPEEVSLLKLLVRFSEAVEEAGKQYSPTIMTNYLFDLAQTFNLFYQKQRILDPENSSHPRESEDQIPDKAGVTESGSPIEVGDDDKESQNDNTRSFRLALTQATGNTLKQGLNLLGIQAPEKM